MYVFGYVHAIMSLILLLQYWLIRASFLTNRALREKASEDYRVDADISISYLSERQFPAFVWQLYYTLTWPLMDFQSLYIVAYAVASCFGALTEHKFLFAVHLLDFCRREPVLKTVLSVVSNKANQLLVTLGLGYIVVYLYTVWGFLYLNGEYQIANKGGDGTNCHWYDANKSNLAQMSSSTSHSHAHAFGCTVAPSFVQLDSDCSLTAGWCGMGWAAGCMSASCFTWTMVSVRRLHTIPWGHRC